MTPRGLKLAVGALWIYILARYATRPTLDNLAPFIFAGIGASLFVWLMYRLTRGTARP